MNTDWKYLEERPHLWRRQLWLKGTRITAAALVAQEQDKNIDDAELALLHGVPIEAVAEAKAYTQAAQELITQEAQEDARLDQGYRNGGLHRECAPTSGPAQADYLLVGLGNPRPQYRGSPHNLGFELVERYAARWERTLTPGVLNSTAYVQVDGKRILLACPQTFMNDSGMAVHELLHEYNMLPQSTLIIYDDLDLSLGQIRLRAKGGAGKHNGIRNVSAYLGEEIPRLRLGAASESDLAADRYNYVLTPFEETRMPQVQEMLHKAMSVLDLVIDGDFDYAMQEANSS